MARFSLSKLFRSNPFDNPNYPMTEMNVNAFLDQFGGQHRSDSGETVNPHTSMHTSTVWACVKLISEQIAINPLFMYQLDGKGNKDLAVDHDYFDIVTNSPNPEQDAIQFRTAVQTSLLLWGNGYIELQRDNGGRVVSMWHRHSSHTKPVRLPSGKLAYETTDSVDRTARIIDAADMVHIMGSTLDGYVGLSPITYARQSIGGKIAMDKFGGRFFANYAMPQMALLTKNKYKPEDKVKMRADFESQQSGSNQHRVAILEQDMDIKTLSISQEDSQFLESKNATEHEICAIFGVPPHAIGLLDKGIKATVEQQAQDLLSYCLSPWMAKWEKALTSKMFNSRGRSAGRYVVKYDVKGLLRPDAATRQTYYQSAIQNGYLSQNEVRDLEGYNAIPDGNGHFIQLNMQSLALANSTDPVPDGPNTELALEMEENGVKRVNAQYRDWFVDSMSRYAKRDDKSAKSARQCLWPILESITKSLQEGTSLQSAEILGASDETYKAISKYTDALTSRSAKWSGDPNEVIASEFNKVIRTLVVAIEQDIAKQRATERLKSLQADEAKQENE